MHPLSVRIPAYQDGHLPEPGYIFINESYEGETIEQRVARIMNNNEPITDGAPQIYTERGDGVIPEYNIRTDRFEEALTMTNELQQRALAKRQERLDQRKQQNNPQPNNPQPNNNQQQQQQPSPQTGQQ